MAIKVNGKGVSHARSLISAGKIDRDSSWGFSSEEGNKLLGDNKWSEYANWFLAVDDSEDKETKAHYKYPFGKEGKVYRKGVIAAKSRAAAQGETAVEEAADKLLKSIDKDDKEEKTISAGMSFASLRSIPRTSVPTIAPSTSNSPANIP